ncbi:sensor histidine kinase [Haloferula chungangensis]|uniref:Sensor histidine kinase n=1 Tax=Haloferula chungangensis TaxID=1048331 RepID=A0ABW2L892_9BACT
MKNIDSRIQELETELSKLPVPSDTSSGTRRGFQTRGIEENEDLWVEIVLPQPASLDQVVLVPLLAKGAQGQIPGYGFPQRFLLQAFDADGDTHILIDETAENFPNPGIFPVSAACPRGVLISRIRLTATETWKRNAPQVLALAEMIALSGNRNLATKAEVRASSSREMYPTWSRSNLIDMETPLGLPVLPLPTETMSGWHSDVATRRDTQKQVTLDLGTTYKVDELRFVPARPARLSATAQYGFPSRFIVEASTQEDFSDSWLIHDQRESSLPPPGQNLLQFDLAGKPLRFVRMTSYRLRERSADYVLALGEMQAYVGNRNIAIGKTTIADESLENDRWGRVGLTDGLTAGGKLIELPKWFRGLEKRRRLENEKALLTAGRAKLLEESEKTLVFGSIVATCSFAVFAGLYVLRSKRQRRLDRELHRERLARDLHDELGSNLGSIALISSFAKEGEGDEAQMRRDLIEIEEVARESADSMRDMVELLGGGHAGAANDWLAVTNGLASRLLRDVKLDCRLPERPLLIEPDLETRREIYLFCKEVLHNIAKHADANFVSFHLKPKANGLRIEISDDGCGFDPSTVSQGHGLSNLQKRAAGLRASLSLESLPGRGTFISLDVPRGRRWRKPKTR